MTTLVLAATERQRIAAARRVERLRRRITSGVLTRQSFARLMEMVRETQDRLRSQLATGTDFDQAFARRLLASLDAELGRLRWRMTSEMAAEFARVMQAADAGVVSEAARVTDAITTTVGVDPALMRFAAENSSDLIGQMSADLRGKVARVVRQGAVGSSDTRDVAREIGSIVTRANRPAGVFGKFADQVERIHRTETARLYEGAADARREQLSQTTSLTVTKTWVHVLRLRQAARPDHDYLHLVEIPQDEHFNVGGGPKWSKVSWETAKREGGTLGFKARGPQDSVLPAQHVVNCGCTIAPGFAEKE